MDKNYPETQPADSGPYYAMGVFLLILFLVAIVCLSSNSCTTATTTPQNVFVPASPVQCTDKICTDKKCDDKSGILDVTYYNNTKLFLLINGSIKKDNNALLVTNNVVLIQINNYNGILYGLGKNGILYEFTGDFDSFQWTWTSASWAPTGIYFMSVDLSLKYLWVQYIVSGVNTGQLFTTDSENNEIIVSTETIVVNTYRVYGKDSDSYVVINKSTSTGTI